MLLFLISLLMITSWWLKCYTRHGQSIELPDFIGKNFEEANRIASKHDFELVKIDSVFKVDQPGSIILQQNPLPGSHVKEDRKVYLVVTKHTADLIPLSALPKLYGQSYESKSAELKKGFDITTMIAGYIYDAGPVNYIMGVIYQGDTLLNNKIERLDYSIPKGGTLGMILSKDTGADISLPNVVCMNYTAAAFLLNSLGLVVDEIEEDVLNNKNESYVTHQEPLFDADYSIKSGDTVHIYLNSKKPADCQ